MEEMPANISEKQYRKDPGSDPVLENFKGVKLETADDVEEAIGSAFDDVMEKLDKNPNDPELNRQANLLLNRVDDISDRLRAKLQSH